jgi:hypothetical protein
MPANVQPIYSKEADVQWTTTAMTALNTTKDLTSGTIYLAFTADATNGGFVQRIRFRSLGTSGSATVARIWINNGATTATAANNTLIDEISLPTITNTETAAQSNYELPLNFALSAGYRIYVTLGVAPGAGWQATVFGGKY